MIAATDLYWAAGFIDGEGCFSRHRSTVAVRVAQKDQWPILKLQALFGGKVNRYTQKQGGRSYWYWDVYGSRAVGVMMTLFSLLSPRRQERIEGNLLWWRSLGLRGRKPRVSLPV